MSCQLSSPMHRRCRAKKRATDRSAAARGDQEQSGAEGRPDQGGGRRRTPARHTALPVPQLWPAASAPLEHDPNEAAFGTDYFTRTAVAKSNILVNSPNETKYFYQDLDAAARGSTAPTATP